MKKSVFLLLLTLLPTLVMAQVSGGQVTRPVKKLQNKQQTGIKPTNSNSKQKVVREVTYESTLSTEERKAWYEEKERAKEKMKQLAYNLKMQNIEPRGNFHEGLAPCNKGYIDKSGNLVIVQKNDYARCFHNGYAIVNVGYHKWGAIDKKGNVIIPFEYFEVDDYSEGLFRVMNDIDYKSAYINERKEIIIPFDNSVKGRGVFSEGSVIAYNKDGKKGYINKAGNVIIPFEYQDGGRFKEGLAPVSKNDKWGYIDKQGNVKIPFIYDGAEEFNFGLGLVEKNGKQGFIDSSGNIVIPLKYGVNRVQGSFGVGYISENLIFVRNSSKYGYIDIKGKLIIPYKYNHVGNFSEGLACVAFYYHDNNHIKYGFINKKGQTVIPFKYIVTRRVFYDRWSSIFLSPSNYPGYEFSENLAYIEVLNDLGENSTKGGYVDKYGNSTFDFE